MRLADFLALLVGRLFVRFIVAMLGIELVTLLECHSH